MRLMPPRRRPRRLAPREDAETERWAKGLHQKSRSTLILVLGNALLLLVLVGGPLLRGQRRARATFVAHAAFTHCLLGAKTALPVGIGAAKDEPERFADQVLARAAGWPGRCLPALRAVAPEDAVFILPGLKRSEARVREAARVVELELKVLDGRAPGASIPVRPLKATAQLREAVRLQGEESGLVELPLHSVLDDVSAASPPPASLPLYAARDAVVTLWGQDHVLHAIGIDATGVSYLEAQAGSPYRRARLPRPASLRGLFHGASASLLVWATPEERCRERALGCHGKTSGIATVEQPLFELPSARYVAAHVAGRPDRSLALADDKLHLAVRAESGRVTVRSLPFSAALAGDETLPPIVPSASFPFEVDEALLLEGRGRPWMLGSLREQETGVLSLLSSSGVEPIARFEGAPAPWMSACTQDDGLSFVAGSADALVVGRVSASGRVVSAPLSLPVSTPVDPEDPRRDNVAALCGHEPIMAVALAGDGALTVIQCNAQAAQCRRAVVASSVRSFDVLHTRAGALFAFEGGPERPQIVLRALEAARFALSPAHTPAACWSTSRGMCGPPILERLGGRVVLGAREGTDLSLLESADDGLTWTTPSVL